MPRRRNTFVFTFRADTPLDCHHLECRGKSCIYSAYPLIPIDPDNPAACPECKQATCPYWCAMNDSPYDSRAEQET
jgi:hypothetical protein